jgi:hypothetical protein
MGIITSFVGASDAQVASLHARRAALRTFLEEVDESDRRDGDYQTMDLQESWEDFREILDEDPGAEVMAALTSGGRLLGAVRDDRGPARTFTSQQVAAMWRTLLDTVHRERRQRRRSDYDETGEEDEAELERAHMLRRLDKLQLYLSALVEGGLGMVVRGI